MVKMVDTKVKVRDIGIPNVEPPENVCDDPNCPFHGSLPVRGRIMEGIVTSVKMHKSITFQTDYLRLVKNILDMRGADQRSMLIFHRALTPR